MKGIVSPRILFLAVVITLSLIAFSAASAKGPSWKVGRAVIFKVQATNQEKGGLVLKLSLRNKHAGNVAVTIYGRWQRTQQEKPRKLKQGELKNFKKLGRFSKEVAFRKTAILKIPLGPVGRRSPNKTHLELIVMTGSRITDHKLVRLSKTRPSSGS